MAATRVCPNCKVENNIWEHFCVRCGTLLACMPICPAGEDGSDEPVPDATAETPQPDTEALLKQVASASGWEHRKTQAGYRVVVPIEGGRRQKVHVLFSGHDDDGQDVISFLSVCGPADPRRAMGLLRLNGRLTYGAFAVRSLGGKEHFVVTANQLAATADPDEIRKELFEVAKRADAVEEKLSRGADVY